MSSNFQRILICDPIHPDGIALSLQVAPVDKLLPHEYHNPQRMVRLAERIAADGLLVNPPIVAPLDDERYIVLDGATRVTAFHHLGYPHLVVQVVDPVRDNVQVYSWSHAVRGGSQQALLALIRSIDGLQLTNMPVGRLAHALYERSAIGYLITADKQGFLLESAEPSAASDAWLEPLASLVERYGAWGEVERTLTHDVETLRRQYLDLAALVVFPQIPLENIIRFIGRGRLLPAGITRFVVPRRILRLNAPLDRLIGPEPIAQKRAWLEQLVQKKLAGRGVRYYEEPVVLLDE